MLSTSHACLPDNSSMANQVLALAVTNGPCPPENTNCGECLGNNLAKHLHKAKSGHLHAARDAATARNQRMLGDQTVGKQGCQLVCGQQSVRCLGRLRKRQGNTRKLKARRIWCGHVLAKTSSSFELQCVASGGGEGGGGDRCQAGRQLQEPTWGSAIAHHPPDRHNLGDAGVYTRRRTGVPTER